MTELKYITYEYVIKFNQSICETYNLTYSIRDQHLLESAVGSSFILFEEEGYLHGSVPEIAATLCYKIAKNHPFFDGNKRTAASTALVFLELNNYDIDYEEYGDEDTEFHRQILSFVANDTNLDDLKKWFLDHTQER